LVGTRQVEVIAELTADLDNIRAMLRHAIEQVRLDALEKAVMPFYQYCDLQGRFQELSETLLRVSKSLENLSSLQERRILAILDSLHGWTYLRLGQFEDSQAAFERSYAFYDEMGISPPPGFGTDPSNGLADVANTQGAYREAMKIGERARKEI